MARRFGQARSVALDISPLRESVPFRALWFGQVVSLLGTQMRYVAVPLQVFRLTGSTAAVGLIGLAEVVPLIVFSIVGGAIADVVDRRRLMAFAQAGLMVTSGMLALVALADRPPLWLLYAITALASAVGSIDRPARTAALPRLVGVDKLPAAMALRQVVFQTTQLVGPVIAGLLLAQLGFALVYALDGVTFVAGMLSLRWVPPLPPEGESAGVNLTAVREGFGFIRSSPMILSILLIDLVAMIFGMPRAVFPELAERTFEMGAAGLGLL